MDGPSSYAYSGQSPPPTQRYSATSSAFSASAQPHEDWTKISDLAERRRIQNRIAQRNYRKKLKKRLEDLERRAASHSASPEQTPAELEDPKSRRRHSEQISSKTSPQHLDFYRSPSGIDPSLSSPPFLPPIQDERSLFSQQYTRQVSTSPPPFAYSPYPAETPASYAYATLPAPMPVTCADMPLFSTYASAPLTPSALFNLDAAAASTYPPLSNTDAKMGQDINPFNMTFATMAGIDVTAANAYTNSNPQTPPLMEFFEQSIAGTPPDSKCPATPAMPPMTPDLLLAEDILNSL